MTIPGDDSINAYLMDMDGVLVRGAQLVSGAAEFIARLHHACRHTSAHLAYRFLCGRSRWPEKAARLAVHSFRRQEPYWHAD
jgi:beta-phosphoglucomutase-like phosphatase (HAD superfamily)